MKFVVNSWTCLMKVAIFNANSWQNLLFSLPLLYETYSINTSIVWRNLLLFFARIRPNVEFFRRPLVKICDFFIERWTKFASLFRRYYTKFSVSFSDRSTKFAILFFDPTTEFELSFCDHSMKFKINFCNCLVKFAIFSNDRLSKCALFSWAMNEILYFIRRLFNEIRGINSAIIRRISSFYSVVGWRNLRFYFVIDCRNFFDGFFIIIFFVTIDEIRDFLWDLLMKFENFPLTNGDSRKFLYEWLTEIWDIILQRLTRYVWRQRLIHGYFAEYALKWFRKNHFPKKKPQFLILVSLGVLFFKCFLTFRSSILLTVTLNTNIRIMILRNRSGQLLIQSHLPINNINNLNYKKWKLRKFPSCESLYVN